MTTPEDIKKPADPKKSQRQAVFVYNKGGTLLETSSTLRCQGEEDSNKWDSILNHGGSNFVLHHMIPWEALGRVLALAVNSARSKEKTARSTTLLASILEVSQRSGRTKIDDLVTALNDLELDDGKFYATTGVDGYKTTRSVHPAKPGHLGELVVDLVNHWCWMPGNLFAGTGGRSDDPGHWGFDFPPEKSLRMDLDRLAAKNWAQHNVVPPGTQGGAEIGEAEDRQTAVQFAARYEALFELWTTIRGATDEALAREDEATSDDCTLLEQPSPRTALLNALKKLAPFELWRPRRLIVAKTPACWNFPDSHNKFASMKSPAATTPAMKEELVWQQEVTEAKGLDNWLTKKKPLPWPVAT